MDDTYEEVNGQTINSLELKNVTMEDQETVMECRWADLFLWVSLNHLPLNFLSTYNIFYILISMPIQSVKTAVKNDKKKAKHISHCNTV